MSGFLIIVISVILLFVGLFLSQFDRPQPSPTDSEQPESENESTDTVIVELEEVVSPHQPESEFVETIEISTTEPELVVDEIEASQLMWERIDEREAPIAQIPSFPSANQTRVLVKLSTDILDSEVGDVIQFPIPQRDIVLDGKISEIGGTTRTKIFKGEVTDEDVQFPFILTVGPNSAYATVSTITGAYELFATENRELGWIMPRESLEDHIDYSVPDHFIENPDPHEHPPHTPP